VTAQRAGVQEETKSVNHYSEPSMKLQRKWRATQIGKQRLFMEVNLHPYCFGTCESRGYLGVV